MSHGPTPNLPITGELLHARGEAQTRLHAQAAAVARRQFGDEVFVRAVVEPSNFCRENCHYCGMRRDNRDLARFRARHDELAELLIHHRPASVMDVNIQTGEDILAVREVVLPLIRTLKRETKLGISVCLGTLNPELYDELKAAGGEIYIMKFELGDATRYGQLEAPGSLAERTDHIRRLAAGGWRVSSGFIAGLPGQTEAELIHNFELATSLPLAGCSVSPFIPGDETPLADAATADLELTLNCMALLRLMRPEWVIPAVSALNLVGTGGEAAGGGYARGLRTGANLATINLTPDAGRGDYLLYKRDRFIMTEERILNAIAAEKLRPAGRSLAEFYRSQPATPSQQPALAAA